MKASKARLVRTVGAAITGLAHQLHTNGDVSQADVDEALFLPADEPNRNHALSLIRSVPGGFTVQPVGTRV